MLSSVEAERICASLSILWQKLTETATPELDFRWLL